VFCASATICCSVGSLPVISPTTSATDTSPQLSSSDCCRQNLAAATGSPYTPAEALGDVAGDDVGGGLLDALVVVGDVAGLDDAKSHAVTRETLAMPMKAHITAARAWVAIRELNVVLIGLVNHHSACDAQVFHGKSNPASTSVYHTNALTKALVERVTVCRPWPRVAATRYCA
jgi:hypothetical protein